ncbi:hypothetical protein ACIRRH_08775, partial [Kitasatospora sp. NPDC101235]
HRRPALDAPSLEAAGTDYTDRWTMDRCGHLWAGTEPVTAGATPAATTTMAGPAPARPAKGGAPAGGWKATAGWDTPPAAPDDELESIWLLPSATKDGDTPDGTDWADPSTWTTGREESAPETPGAKDAALRLLRDAGPEGTGASAMERAMKDTYGTRRPVLQNWLKTWVENGDAIRIGEGSKTRYVHRDHAPDA